MDSKAIIRKRLQESLLREKTSHEAAMGHSEKEDDKASEKGDRERTYVSKKGEGGKGTAKLDYQDIRDEFNKGVIKQVGIMKMMGIPDDEKGTNRSLFRKKLFQEKNEDGSYYQFTEDEVAEIRALIDLN